MLKNDLSAKRCPFLKIFANIGRISSELIDSMAGLRSRDNTFHLCKQATGFERFQLLDIYRFHEIIFE